MIDMKWHIRSNILKIFCIIAVEADASQMGGFLSHEYHYLSPIGEAKLQKCLNCGHFLVDDRETRDVNELKCPKCHANNIKHTNGIEVIEL